jgi:hypothetical protein
MVKLMGVFVSFNSLIFVLSITVIIYHRFFITVSQLFEIIVIIDLCFMIDD